MIKEIYCRMPSDSNFLNNGDGKVFECQNIEEALLQRIRVCLGTHKGDVLGDPNFGIDLEDYIYNMSVDAAEIEKDVRLYLTQYAMLGYEDFYSMEIGVHFGKDVTAPTAPHDYFIIDVILNNQKAMGIIVA